MEVRAAKIAVALVPAMAQVVQAALVVYTTVVMAPVAATQLRAAVAAVALAVPVQVVMPETQQPEQPVQVGPVHNLVAAAVREQEQVMATRAWHPAAAEAAPGPVTPAAMMKPAVMAPMAR